jgi:CheY-like chemotaxis protein
MQSSSNIIEAGNAEVSIKSARILIVDDEFTMRKMMRTLLLSLGVIDVHEAVDGASALAAIGALDPDVVLLDWQLAEMNAPEFVRRVRSPGKFSHPNVPIIMLAGHGEPSRVIEAMRLGVHGFLLKPVSGEALCERLASVLMQAGAAGRHRPSRPPLRPSATRSDMAITGGRRASLGSTGRSRM